MNLSLHNKLVFVVSFQCLSSPLDSLIKNLGKVDFKHLGQDFDSEVLKLVKQKGFYTYKCFFSFRKFEKGLPS